MVTINDIAQQAGVAKSTVSRYLNGGSVSQKTKDKLAAIVAETGYRPNTFAQSLKAKKTTIIGTIIPRLDSYSANEVLISIDKGLREKNFQLLITNTNQDSKREIESIYSLASQKVAGILLFATVITEAHKKAIADVAIPVILLGQQADDLYSIVHDEYDAGYKIGKYATDLGHKNFLYLTVFEADVAVGKMRKKGVLDALNESKETTIELVETSFTFEKAYEQVIKMLPNVTASYIICATDNIALAVLKAAHQLKIVIPNVFSLSGFGGYQITTVVSPTITTVKYAYQELGEIAVKNLLLLLEGLPVPKKTILKNKLIENESTKRLN
ncbi:transcriptional regulator, LacI family [Carnobacterium iners]|uniref:Transcriptional regulator, LacI family n=1 Tax=Carnobacterium iners TaxID=1073423 RepID=A0A1X7N1W2_9LACT|nr:LacI family DNA-binding transcriptional regulator [Carnobacterium iners]SEK96633.1 transcriptional regulator, LacI family [Carnobacterium iners]SMH31262.1 transcriptional regulator, LacI family [Carnobacterium iners]